MSNRNICTSFLFKERSYYGQKNCVQQNGAVCPGKYLDCLKGIQKISGLLIKYPHVSTVCTSIFITCVFTFLN